MLKTTKRFLAVLLCIVLTFSMMATVFAEESTETATVSETAEVSTEAEEGSTEVAGAEVTGEKVLDGNTEITDEQIEEIYNSIKKSVLEEYIEPYDIPVDSFEWSNDPLVWFALDGFLISPNAINSFSEAPELTQIMYIGIDNWLEKQGTYNNDYLLNIRKKMEPLAEKIPANIDFTVPLEEEDETETDDEAVTEAVSETETEAVVQ